MAESLYRPRLKTQAEEFKEKESKNKKRKWQHGKRQLEEQQMLQRSNQFIPSDGGYSFRDSILGPGRTAVNSRTALDASNYLSLTPIDLSISRPSAKEIPSLSAICIAKFANNYANARMLEGLEEDHAVVVESLLNAVDFVLRDQTEGQRRKIWRKSPTLPFRLWLAVSHDFGTELPLKRRTYRGLTLADTNELDILSSSNSYAIQSYHADPHSLPLPTFVLYLLDLSSTAFADEEIFTLNPLSPFLAVLKLDRTTVTDDGIQKLAMSAQDEDEEDGEGRYTRLELLSLKGLSKVTDKSAKKLRKLASLRALHLSETSCTTAFQEILNQRHPSLPASMTQPRWRTPTYHRHDDPSIARGEAFLFSPFHSLSHHLTTLHTLAFLDHPSSDATLPPPQKPICIHINSLSRVPKSAPPTVNETSSTQELYQRIVAQGTYATSKAAYNPAYGTITSSNPINTEVFNADGNAQKDKGSAFRMRDESKAAGNWVGGVGGRTSLWEMGNRKLSEGWEEEEEEEVVSDWGEEGLEIDQRRNEYEEERIEGLQEMYRLEAAKREEVRRQKREEPTPLGTNKLTLVRDLPPKLPYGRRPLSEEERRETERSATEGTKKEVLREGTSLRKKRPREVFGLDDVNSYVSSNLDPDPTPSPSSFPQNGPTPSPFSRASATPIPQRATPPSSYLQSKPSGSSIFAKKPLIGSNSAQKPLGNGKGNGGVGQPQIKKRSSLAVFRK